jgi:hypothetical protein
MSEAPASAVRANAPTALQASLIAKSRSETPDSFDTSYLVRDTFSSSSKELKPGNQGDTTCIPVS